MTPRVGVHMIVGGQAEPFLEAALRSVEWADYFCVVNSDPTSEIGRENEQTVKATVPARKLRYLPASIRPRMDFAAARNTALRLADPGDYVLIVDADDVHYPDFEGIARGLIAEGCDMVAAHFWHLMLCKNLWQSEPHREILFRHSPDVRFALAVHEQLVHPRRQPSLADYHYVHYGYIKPPRDVFARWKLYAELEGNPDFYGDLDPDDALSDRLEECRPFWREHPPAALKALKGFPDLPPQAPAREANVGLILLTYDDAELLARCLPSLATTRQPFELLCIDNGSQDNSLGLVRGFEAPACVSVTVHVKPDLPLARALNEGLRHYQARPGIDYVGWVHPDMVFEDHRWLECLRHALDTNRDVVKAAAANSTVSLPPGPISGVEQCWLLRKSVLGKVGLYDEEFRGIGGREDWDFDRRLLEHGRVMIWPTAPVRHHAMGTRSRRNTDADARHNAAHYQSKWGTDAQAV